MNRALLAVELAPEAPPCFMSRSLWLGFVEAAATGQRVNRPGPLLFEAGQPVRFNPSFSFCSDCDVATRSAMLKRSRCVPSFVRRQLTSRSERAAAVTGAGTGQRLAP